MVMGVNDSTCILRIKIYVLPVYIHPQMVKGAASEVANKETA